MGNWEYVTPHVIGLDLRVSCYFLKLWHYHVINVAADQDYLVFFSLLNSNSIGFRLLVLSLLFEKKNGRQVYFLLKRKPSRAEQWKQNMEM